MTTRYYNTVGVTGEELEERQVNVSKQEDIVLDFFKAHPGILFTPFDVRDSVLVDAPITSVRRAITNLTQFGHLVKTKTRQRGPYGHLNYCWMIEE